MLSFELVSAAACAVPLVLTPELHLGSQVGSDEELLWALPDQSHHLQSQLSLA